MLKVNPEVIKAYREHLIKTLKELIKPYLKDSEYREEESWEAPNNHSANTGKVIKLCLFKRQVRLKFFDCTVVGFTPNEVITNYGICQKSISLSKPCIKGLETISLSKLCIEDLQVLAELDLDFLVKVQKPASQVSSKKGSKVYRCQ